MRAPTEKQLRILRFIGRKQETEGLAPTFREIAAHFRFRSANAALVHVQALLRKGALRHLPGRARSLQVVDPHAPRNRARSRVVSVPVYGTIPAGRPLDATQENEGCVMIDANTLGIKPTARTFGLKVRGDSMTGKGILEGDIAVVENGVTPRNGDVVAALIDGNVTLKTFILQKGKPFLRAENPLYPNLVPKHELQVQGVMVALIRKRPQVV
jgi:repressor LexA